MCNYFSDYKITNSNNIDKLKKLESWELAIGLNEVDNLKPSEYLIELTKDSIDNNKTYNYEIGAITKNYLMHYIYIDKETF